MSGSTEGYTHEPIRGLPGHLPQGEHILWQASPDWKRLAFTAFHIRGVAAYFALLVVWALISASTVAGVLLTVIAGVLAVGLLALIAWASARSTVYTLTNRRVVMRIGIALPTCINIPLKRVANAALALHADGTGDIPLALTETTRLGWFLLWTHARPWKLGRPEPMLRAVPNAETLANTLARALADEVPDGRRVAVKDAGSVAAPVGGVQVA